MIRRRKKAGNYDNGRQYRCLARQKMVTGMKCMECFSTRNERHRAKYYYSRACCVEENRMAEPLAETARQD